MSNIVNYFLIFIAWVMIVNAYANPLELPEYELYVDEIATQFILKMEKEHDLICIGSGGSMPYDVETIKIMFLSYNKASIDQARELEVQATEKLKNIVNSHEKIRPFLREYPFTIERSRVLISFRKKNMTPYFDNSVAHISQVRGRLLYCSMDPKTEQYVDLLEEPYEEAKQKVLPSIKEL